MGCFSCPALYFPVPLDTARARGYNVHISDDGKSSGRLTSLREPGKVRAGVGGVREDGSGVLRVNARCTSARRAAPLQAQPVHAGDERSASHAGKQGGTAQVNCVPRIRARDVCFCFSQRMPTSSFRCRQPARRPAARPLFLIRRNGAARRISATENPL